MTSVGNPQPVGPRPFDADGALFRLASEARRIRLAHLSDPWLAIHSARIEPLPHQIAAVYGEMLPRRPLRFLLADDPGAGKTIMAGLLIKELTARGDAERCLVVAPGGLVEQWQDELREKFGLNFGILTRDRVSAAGARNPFSETGLWIARLDMLARDPALQSRLEAAPEWDLVVCDEAHRMSAGVFGSETRYTRRYRLAQRLGARCRHFLLMTATPHNGKEEDFRLFMALLDADRFEGRSRDGAQPADASDLMRRLTKEELLEFDGTPLFPERRAHTVAYALSTAETELYAAVTGYVREEMDRAERLAADGDDGDDGRRRNIGFALTTLQRRLASSPAAIHESLRRRRERLEARLAEERRAGTGRESRLAAGAAPPAWPGDETELEDALDSEREAAEQAVLDRATAARNLAELETEIDMLAQLEARARALRRSGVDAKWVQLEGILHHPSMSDAGGERRKLIVFTEPRDTLNYLADRIRARLGQSEAVAVIHGGMGRRERRNAVAAFVHDRDTSVLVANDAAGEGINLQRAHLMVNYDLPWNPNRLEQRFGRIHRIGQTEICHCWNLVAADTREGEVYARLLSKIETARAALGGRVYDVMGRLFQARALRDLLMEAIRYGERPEARQRLLQAVDAAADGRRLKDLVAGRAPIRDRMTAADAARIRDEMERAEARRLQPFHIQTFFLEAFERLGGSANLREAGRWEVARIPAPIRERDRPNDADAPIPPRYERICFEKSEIDRPPLAAHVCPGHPLLDATVDLILERHGDLLQRGAVLADDADDGEALRTLFYLEHEIRDGLTDRGGGRRTVSRRFQFVEIGADGHTRDAGPAPYLDYRPLEANERPAIAAALETRRLSGDAEASAARYAAASLAPRHLEEVRARRLPEIRMVERAVTARLKNEINYWDRRARELEERERAGRRARLSAARAAARANGLADRLQRRLAALAQECDFSSAPPTVRGAAIVAPAGLLRRAAKAAAAQLRETTPEGRAAVERLAMEAVAAAERALGHAPRDVSAERLGYDIESRESGGRLRFIEVKGRAAGADTVTVTRNEILTALNAPDAFILAIVEIADGAARAPRYLRTPFAREPDFGATSVTYRLADLLDRATPPR